MVTLARPEIHNALDDALINSLQAELIRLAAEESIRVVILTGEGRSFCAGADLAWMRRAGELSPQENLDDALRVAELLRALDGFHKPTVAAVNGPAFGGGAGLVACCDVAIASDAAQFSFSEVRLGLIPAVISPYVIAAIGARQARRYFLSAESFSAAEARRIGLVHEVASPNDFPAVVEAAVAEILRGGPQALRSAKDLIAFVSANQKAPNLPADTAQRIARVRAGEEARQGMKAFLEKKRPPWRPKSSG
jgi:methylglutaconyl-CoA hydratase